MTNPADLKALAERGFVSRTTYQPERTVVEWVYPEELSPDAILAILQRVETLSEERDRLREALRNLTDYTEGALGVGSRRYLGASQYLDAARAALDSTS